MGSKTFIFLVLIWPVIIFQKFFLVFDAVVRIRIRKSELRIRIQGSQLIRFRVIDCCKQRFGVSFLGLSTNCWRRIGWECCKWQSTPFKGRKLYKCTWYGISNCSYKIEMLCVVVSVLNTVIYCGYMVHQNNVCGSYESTRVNIKKARLGLYCTVYLSTALTKEVIKEQPTPRNLSATATRVLQCTRSQ